MILWMKNESASLTSSLKDFEMERQWGGSHAKVGSQIFGRRIERQYGAMTGACAGVLTSWSVGRIAGPLGVDV